MLAKPICNCNLNFLINEGINRIGSLIIGKPRFRFWGFDWAGGEEEVVGWRRAGG